MNRSSIAAAALFLALLLALVTWRLFEPDSHSRVASTEATAGVGEAAGASQLVDATPRAAHGTRAGGEEDERLDPPVPVDESTARAPSALTSTNEDELARIVNGLMQGTVRLEELSELALELLAAVDSAPTVLPSGLHAYRLVSEEGGRALGSLMVSSAEPRSFTFTLPAPAPVELHALDPQSDARLQLSFRRHPDGGVECKSVLQVHLDYSPAVHQALSGGSGAVIGGAFEATAEGTAWRPLVMRTDLDAAGEPTWSTELGEPVGLTPASLRGSFARDLSLALAKL